MNDSNSDSERCEDTHRSLLRAFSLVEMLMALLVASLILAALAPVVTRKFGENIHITGSMSNFTTPPCVYINDTLADTEDAICTVPEGVLSMNAIIASGGGGGGGAVDKAFDARELLGGEVTGKVSTVEIKDTGTQNRCDSGNNNQSEYKDFEITKDMRDIWIELVGGGSGGGGGNTNLGGHPAQQSDCGNWGIYIAPEYNGNDRPYGVCVSKYNMGDVPGTLDIVQNNSKVVPVGVNESTYCGANMDCCFRGQTIDSLACLSANGSYNACNRTVCQWNAANRICNSWAPYGNSGPKARLPQSSEITRWVNNANDTIIGKGDNGLQLCVHEVVNNAQIAWCTNRNDGIYSGNNGRCYYGSYYSDCAPRYLWAGDECPWHADTTVMAHCALNGHSNTSFSISGYVESLPFSVRCVVDNYYEASKPEFKAYHGAGAHPAHYGKIKIPDEVLKRAFEPDNNGKIAEKLQLRLFAGSGGRGSLGKSGCYAQQGTESSAVLYRNGSPIWAFGVRGGNEGPGATNTADGDMNTVVLVNGTIDYADYEKGDFSKLTPGNVCAYLNIFDDKFNDTFTWRACSEVPGVTINSGKPADRDGNGGTAFWNGQYGTQAKFVNNASNGADGVFGGGGAGASCTEGKTRLKPNCGNGGNGGPGAARFTYKRSYPGAGGGGGGAGVVAHLKNIAVNPGDIIKVQAGGKGLGGYAGSDGGSGGDSFIELKDGNKYTVFGGKGGKAGIGAIIPLTGAVTYAVGGEGGSGGDVSGNITAMVSGGSKNGKYYPEKLEETKGNNAPENSDIHALKALGGNGGINSKISVTGTGNSNNRFPCGGYSNIPIVVNKKSYECKTTDYKPLILSRTLSISDINMNVINTYALGGTGGGGGGWNNDFTPSSGADGMGGYVIIYFE